MFYTGPDFASVSPPEIRDRLETKGYVIFHRLIGDAQLAQLRSASQKLVNLARAGKWPNLRTLPKQFPPWQSTPENGIWGVQHLLHPGLPLDEDEKDAFKELYFGDEVIGVVKAVLGDEGNECEEGMLVMELFNMLVTPDREFELRWHRDDVSFDMTLQEEAAALGLTGQEAVTRLNNTQNVNARNPTDTKRKVTSSTLPNESMVKRDPYHTQYNIPLFADDSLHLIPGSHLRPRTEDEAAKLARDPFTDELEGWIKVELKPGDVAFYDNDLIHRGVYNSTKERLTLHGSVGDVRADGKRARNVLQHGCAWADQCDFTRLPEHLRQRAEGMRQRLVELGSRDEDVGFSHQD